VWVDYVRVVLEGILIRRRKKGKEGIYKCSVVCVRRSVSNIV
jgi:hypothetical protein